MPATECKVFPIPDKIQEVINLLNIRLVNLNEMGGFSLAETIGTVNGLSYLSPNNERLIWINPEAPYPVSTLIHELGHLILSHNGNVKLCHDQVEYEADLFAISVDNKFHLFSPEERQFRETKKFGHELGCNNPKTLNEINQSIAQMVNVYF